MKIYFKFILIAIFFTSGCSSIKNENKVSTESPGSGGYFLDICENPRSQSCVAFLTGYLSGQEHMLSVLKVVEKNKEPYSYYILQKFAYGCNLKMENLNWDEMVYLFKSYIVKNKISMDRKFSDIYYLAVGESFKCEK